MSTLAPMRRLAQADLLLLASSAFALPSEDLRCELAGSADGSRALAARAGAADPDRLGASAQAMGAAAAELDLRGWSDEFVRLFDSRLACPINEAAYVRRDKGAILGDIAGFYRAFGFQLVDGAGERVDHLVCELEFLAMLLVMRAQAARGGQPKHVRITADAIAAFVVDHLGVWLPMFCRRLEETTELALYRRAAAILTAALGAVCERDGLSLPPDDAGSIPDDDASRFESCDPGVFARGRAPAPHAAAPPGFRTR